MKVILSFVLVVAVATAGRATTYYHIGSDPGGSAKAFEDDSRWSTDRATADGKAPIRGDENDEYVLDGGWFRGNVSSRPVNFTFKKFTIKQTHINWKVVGDSRTTDCISFPLLELAGNVENGKQRGRLELGSSGMAWIDGRISVTSPRATPFYLSGQDTAVWAGYGLLADMSSDASAGLRFTSLSSCNLRIVIDGDNSKYYGNFQADAVNGAVWLQFKDEKAFGGQLDTFDPEALILNEGSILEVMTENATLPESLNRGITFNGANVTSNIQLRAETDWTLGCSLAGTGDIVKTGAGTLTIDTDWPATLGRLIVKDGLVVFTEGHRKPSAVVYDGVRIVASCNDTTPVATLDIENGTMLAPIRVELSDQPGVIDSPLTVPVLRFKSALHTLRPCDILIGGLSPAPLRNDVIPTIATDVDGYQIVSVPLLPYITLSDDWKEAMGGKYCPASDVEGVWSNGEIPSGHLGHYCATTNIETQWSSDFRVSDYSGHSADWTFGGASLSLNGAKLCMKERTARFDWLYVTSAPGLSTPGIKWVGCNGTEYEGRKFQSIAGNVAILNSTRANAMVFVGRDDTHATVQADLYGSGWIDFVGEYVNGTAGGSYFYLTGDNSNYIGGFTVKSAYSKEQQVDCPARLILDADTGTHSLGGCPFTFTPDALTIDTDGVLEVRNDFTYDTENRGLTFADSVELSISNAATFRVGQPIVVAAGKSVALQGKGTLAAKSIVGANGSKIVIGEGGFEPLASVALSGAKVEMGAAASLVLDGDTMDAELKSKGLVADSSLLSVAGKTLNVKIKLSQKPATSSATVGILTVPDAEADDWATRVTSAKVLCKGVMAKIMSESADGYTTFRAEITSKGLMLIFR